MSVPDSSGSHAIVCIAGGNHCTPIHIKILLHLLQSYSGFFVSSVGTRPLTTPTSPIDNNNVTPQKSFNYFCRHTKCCALTKGTEKDPSIILFYNFSVTSGLVIYESRIILCRPHVLFKVLLTFPSPLANL